jgi:hydrogenase maturation protease
MNILIIGIGNRSRNDDGAGWFVIEQLQQLDLPGVELHAVHQLEVDLAETISHCDVVIFVDAIPSDVSPAATCTVVDGRWQAHAVAHFLTPADLLALAEPLYGRQPYGVLFSVPADDFRFGATLSPGAEQAARETVERVRALVASLQSEGVGLKGEKLFHA